jgi:transcriptional regulator with XRE-family HTH domain
MTFSEIIKRARIAKGMRQVDVAALVGVTQATWSLWERGNDFPSVENAKRIAGVLEVDEEEILKSLEEAKVESKVKKYDGLLKKEQAVTLNNDSETALQSVLVRICKAVGEISPSDFEIEDLEKILAEVNRIESVITAPLAVSQIMSLTTALLTIPNEEEIK